MTTSPLKPATRRKETPVTRSPFWQLPEHLLVVGPNVSAHSGPSCPQVSQEIGHPKVLVIWTLCTGFTNLKSWGTFIPVNTQQTEIPAMCGPVEDRKLSISVNADFLYTADNDFIKLCFRAASLQFYQPLPACSNSLLRVSNPLLPFAVSS